MTVSTHHTSTQETETDLETGFILTNVNESEASLGYGRLCGKGGKDRGRDREEVKENKAS